MASEYVGEDLARAVSRHAPRNVLLARALVARDTLPALLREAGARVDVVPVYETRRAGETRRRELAAGLGDGSIDVVLFTSSSTVENTAALLGPGEASLLSGATIASIGPITTATAERLGIRVYVTAAEHTVRGLLDSLEAMAPGRPAPAP